MTATSSKDGEFETSTTTWAPLSTSANPSPVSVLTPVLGAAATASWPLALSFVMSFDPIRPMPPITTIFIYFLLLFGRGRRNHQLLFRYLLRLSRLNLCDINFLVTDLSSSLRSLRISVTSALTVVARNI